MEANSTSSSVEEQFSLLDFGLKHGHARLPPQHMRLRFACFTGRTIKHTPSIMPDDRGQRHEELPVVLRIPYLILSVTKRGEIWLG